MSLHLQVLNQVFDLQQKINAGKDAASYERNFKRLFSLFEDEGYIIQNPLHEIYSDSRTDCEASVIGSPAARMKICSVLKPIIYQKTAAQLELVQKAVVMVEKI